MIIELRTKNDILLSFERNIAFAINTEGRNIYGLASRLSKRIWPELSNLGECKLGDIKLKEVNGILYIGMCCYSLYDGWGFNQGILVKELFDSVPTDEIIASEMFGSGQQFKVRGANFSDMVYGMNMSEKKIRLY